MANLLSPASSMDKPRPLAQRFAAILWPSFLMAGVASMVLFALVDPVDLHTISFPGWQLSRTAGYSIGFFMFWAITAASSFSTWLLLRRSVVLNHQAMNHETRQQQHDIDSA